jgi:hypothetical protein
MQWSMLENKLIKKHTYIHIHIHAYIHTHTHTHLNVRHYFITTRSFYSRLHEPQTRSGEERKSPGPVMNLSKIRWSPSLSLVTIMTETSRENTINAYTTSQEIIKGDHLKNFGTYEVIILQGERAADGLIWVMVRTSNEQGNDSPVCVKCEESHFWTRQTVCLT